jgi:hypothetical protein
MEQDCHHLPLTEYQNLKEDLHDLAMVAKRDEGTISLAEIKNVLSEPDAWN